MAFKMKGHALKGPHSFAKQKAKDYERLKKAETEVKTQMYDLAEPGTARADSTGGTYSDANMKRIEKAQADYNKAVERAKKAGIKFDDSPLPQNNKKTNKANKAIEKANTATAAANAYLMEHGTKNDDGSYSLSQEHMKKYNKLKGKADKKGGKADKKSQKAIDAGAERSPMEQKKRAPYKVAPLVAAAGKMAAKAVAGQVASKAASKATGGDE